MGTVNDIVKAFTKLSMEDRRQLVKQIQSISLLERGAEAKKNLLSGDVQRGSASDLINAMHCD